MSDPWSDGQEKYICMNPGACSFMGAFFFIQIRCGVKKLGCKPPGPRIGVLFENWFLTHRQKMFKTPVQTQSFAHEGKNFAHHLLSICVVYVCILCYLDKQNHSQKKSQPTSRALPLLPYSRLYCYDTPQLQPQNTPTNTHG